jgi:methionine-rich copper-binding protein CopC
MYLNKLLSTALLALALTATAQTHTHLEKAMPANNAVLAESPRELMLHFSEATRLTALSIQKEGEKQPQALGSLPKEPSKVMTVPLSPLSAGKYTVSWRRHRH